MEGKQHLVREVIDRCTELYIPVEVGIELTHRCNLRCCHCYIDVRELNELSLEEWKAAIDKLKAAGTMFLLFTGGEPLERRDFLDIAGYARGQGFFIGLLSNFTMVTPELADEIARLGPYKLNTSLYGATAETHDAITGVRGSYNKTLQGIELFVERGLVPDVQTTVMKENVREIREIAKLVAGMGAQSIMDINIVPARSGSNFPMEYIPEARDLRDCGWIPGEDDCTDEDGLCRAGKSVCSISPSGDVYPCFLAPIRLGNINEQDFQDFWTKEPLRELNILRNMKAEDQERCYSCEMKKFCQRCTGISYLECGILTGSSPSACRLAEIRKAVSMTEAGG